MAPSTANGLTCLSTDDAASAASGSPYTCSSTDGNIVTANGSTYTCLTTGNDRSIFPTSNVVNYQNSNNQTSVIQTNAGHIPGVLTSDNAISSIISPSKVPLVRTFARNDPDQRGSRSLEQMMDSLTYLSTIDAAGLFDQSDRPSIDDLEPGNASSPQSIGVKVPKNCKSSDTSSESYLSCSDTEGNESRHESGIGKRIYEDDLEGSVKETNEDLVSQLSQILSDIQHDVEGDMSL